MPLVSVLMPVYNNARYIQDAIDSITGQTFDDFECIIFDDASTDGTGEIIKRNSDPRIKYYRNKHNQGIACTLNHGLDISKGKYIARFDGDDISHSRRIERQVEHMERNSDTGLLGSWYSLIWRKFRQVTIRQPWGTSCVKASLCLHNPVCHSDAMMRKSVLDDHGLRYNNEFSRSEDYDLWIRISQYAKLDNLRDVLLKVRIHDKSVVSTYPEQTKNQTNSLLRNELNKIGLQPTNDELDFHHAIGRGNRQQNKEDIVKSEIWFLKLLEQNRGTGYYVPEGLEKALSFAWYRLCANSGNLGFWVKRYWKSSALSRFYDPSRDELMTFISSIIWNAYFRMFFN